MDIARLKTLAGIVKIEESRKSPDIEKTFKLTRLNESINFVQHVKSHGVSVDLDYDTNIATLVLHEATFEDSEKLFDKVINEWNEKTKTLTEKNDDVLWALYVKDSDQDKYHIQFTDKERSVVADEWVDSWKEQYDDDGKRIKRTHKIIKVSSTKNPPTSITEDATEADAPVDTKQFSSMAEITKAVDAGKKVIWKTDQYVVGKDLLGDYHVTHRPWSRKPDTVLLFNTDGKTSDYKPEDFKINESTNMAEGYTILPSVDADRYVERKGLEGPFRWRNGRIVYYDPKEGKYYDPDTDMYIEYDEYIRANNPDIRESANLNEAKFETIELQLPSHWTSALFNGDTSGLEDGEEAALDRWIEWASNEYNIYAGQPLDVSDDVEFRRNHDADGFVAATDVLTYVYRVNDPVTESESSSTKDDKPNKEGKHYDPDTDLYIEYERANNPHITEDAHARAVERRVAQLKRHIESATENMRITPRDNTVGSMYWDNMKQIERWKAELQSLQSAPLAEDHAGGYYVCYENNKEHHKTEAEATAAKIKLEKSGIKDVTIHKDTDDGPRDAVNDTKPALKEKEDIHTKLHDSDKNSKIKVPKEVKDEAKKQIADIQKSIDEFEKVTKNTGTADIKKNTIDCINQLLEILEGGTLEDLKKAQIFYNTLMNPITVLLPNLLVKFLMEPKHFVKL